MIENLVKSIVNPLVNDLVPINSAEYIFDFLSLQTSLPQSLIDLSATYTRAGTKYNLQNSLYVAYGANAFGTNYDVSEATYGYYPELLATNLWTYSIDFSNAVWTKGSASVAVNADSPLSGGGSYKVIPSVGSGTQALRHSTLVGSGVLSTVSYIAKAAGYKYVSIGPDGAASGNNAVFNLETGTITQNGGVYNSNPKIVSIGNGWYRVSVNINSTTASYRQPRFYVLSNTTAFPSNNNNSAFGGDGTSGVLVWNNQAETGGRASSPIITAGSTATRAADVLSLATSEMPRLTDSQYTIKVDYRLDILPAGASVARLANVEASPDTDTASTARNATDAQGFIIVGGATQAFIESPTTALTRCKQALSAKENEFRFAFNGVADTPDLSGSMPSGLVDLNIGHGTGLEQTNGHIYSVEIYTYAMTDAQLEAATA